MKRDFKSAASVGTISIALLLSSHAYSSDLQKENEERIIQQQELTSIYDSKIFSTYPKEVIKLRHDLEAVGPTGPGDDIPPGGGGGGGGSSSNEYNPEVLAKIGINDQMTPQTTKLLGEMIDLNTGTVSFKHNDVSIPGNSVLPVRFGRIFKGGDFDHFKTLDLGDWMIDIPNIHTTLLKNSTRYSGDWGRGMECSGDLNPGEIANYGSTFRSYEYWNGDTLNIPGKTNEKLLSNSSHITNSSAYPKITKSNYRVRCATRTGGGEKFIVESPDGVIYTFSELRLIQTKSLVKDYKATPRYHAFMLVSEIKDRFGNTVNYNYDSSSKLTSITSNDGRSINISYNSDSFVSQVVANGKTWKYFYDSSKSLERVELPNNKEWLLSLSAISDSKAASTYQNGTDACFLQYQSSASGSITHPNGVIGTFNVESTLMGRAHVTNGNFGGIDYTAKCFGTMALKSKVLSGPGISSLTWEYEYSSNEGFFSGLSVQSKHKFAGTIPSGINNYEYKYTSVSAPDGSMSKYYFNRDYRDAREGSIAVIDHYDTDGTTLLKRVQNDFVQSTNAIGVSEQFNTNIYPHNYRLDTAKSTTYLYDGGAATSYTVEPTSYDKYGHLLSVSEYNSFNGLKRYTKHSYFNDLTNWVLGLPTSTSISSDDVFTPEEMVSSTTYHSESGSYKSLPDYQKTFGRWTTRNESYHTSGSQAGLPKLVRYNGTNRWIEYSNYKRGVAQTTKTPQSQSTNPQYVYKVVNDDGWITKQTDFEGFCTNYGYDVLGRLILLDPCDAAFYNTQVTYSTTTSSGGFPGVTSNMTLQTITKGNYRKQTYFDGLRRPVFTKEWDYARPSTTARYSRKQYNGDNRVTFESQLSSTSSTTHGVTTDYDGIGRVSSLSNSANYATIRYYYLSNNSVETIDGVGNSTTNTFLAYGEPQFKLSTNIESPENVTTTTSYNIFDNPILVKQGNVSEHRVYDAYQNLCKVVRPDVGSTAFVYDEIGRLTKETAGNSVSSNTTTCDTSVLASETIEYTYDNLDNVKEITYGDGTSKKSYIYDKNSRLTQVTFGNVIHNFAYNSQGQMESERQRVDGLDWTIRHYYDAYNNLSAVRYPSGGKLEYYPNALGQPRYVGGVASDVVYHANGSLASFTHANGCYNTISLQQSGLPDVQTSLCGATKAVYNQYTFDKNGNLTFWNDLQENNYDLRLTYDGLDRLDTIKDTSRIQIGDVDYDTIGNIKKLDFDSGTVNYVYNANNLLSSTSGLKSYNMQYDSRGNVISNGDGTFSYNLANQMVASTVLNRASSYQYDANNKRVKVQDSNGTRYSMYSAKGILLHEQINGQNKENYYLGSQLIATRKAGVTTYIHNDLTGNTAAKSNANGTVLTKLRYAPFGSSRGTSFEDGIGYTGHVFDSDSGLNYMQARYYDPAIGRFYSNDPIGVRDVRSFNRYAYANNNPFRYVDPTGMSSIAGQCGDPLLMVCLGSEGNEDDYFEDVITDVDVEYHGKINNVHKYTVTARKLAVLNSIRESDLEMNAQFHRMQSEQMRAMYVTAGVGGTAMGLGWLGSLGLSAAQWFYIADIAFSISNGTTGLSTVNGKGFYKPLDIKDAGSYIIKQKTTKPSIPTQLKHKPKE